MGNEQSGHKLRKLADSGDVGGLRKLMKSSKGGVSGSVLDNQDSNDGRTALHIAVINGHLDMVRLLMEGGASPTLTDATGESSLSLAASQGRNDMLEALLTPASAVPQLLSSSPSALVAAAENGHTHTVRLLVEQHQASPAATEPNGKTALVAALARGHQETVQVLLSLGANPNDGVIPPHVKSPLVASCSKMYGSAPMCLMLLEAGANPNSATADGWTALHQSCLDGSFKQIALLIENGADPYQQNTTGKDAFAIIRDQYGNTPSCQTLIALLNGEKTDMSDESAVWKQVGAQS